MPPRSCHLASLSAQRIASALALVVVLASCGHPDQLAQEPLAPRAAALPTTSATLTPTIYFYDPELDPGPSPTFSPEKMTALAEYEADLQEERDHRATSYALPPGPVDEPFDPYTPQPLPTITTGLLPAEQCGDGPIERLQFWPNNCWTTFTDPGVLTVYAGMEYPFPETGNLLGGVFVLTNTLDYLNPASSQVYWMPIQAGGVTIVQADGMRLTLRADDGSHWIFDITTRSWQPHR